MSKIRCIVNDVVFHCQDNGYSILKVRIKDMPLPQLLVCTFAHTAEGIELECEGEWMTDPKYGKEFKATQCNEVMPETEEGIERYLANGPICGIGKKCAHEIVERFGVHTLDVIETDVEKLLEVPGIGKQRLALIKESWKEHRSMRNLMIFLQECGVSMTYAPKIFKEYGQDCVSVLRENPYCLADDIWGIGFLTADQIAFHLGFEKNDPRRCEAGIIYTMNQISLQGHVYGTQGQITSLAHELLDIDDGTIISCLGHLLETDSLKCDRRAIYLPEHLRAERFVAKALITIMSENGGAGADPLGAGFFSDEQRQKYDKVQLYAITTAVNSPLMVLTGGPGTGKTTTTQGIIEAFEELGLEVILAAPTGRAAKRLSEATDCPASTIHRLLEYNPSDGYKRNPSRKLEGDVLIVDECSMIDIMLMSNLLRAIPFGMTLILVGDTDQLPSVGPGNVLRDIIASDVVPVVKLTRVFRQAQSSRIVMGAHAINQGKLPDIRNGKDSDFFFLRNEEQEDIPAEIVSLVKDRLPRAYDQDPSNIQVLTPMQKGPYGTIALNNLLQEALNPEEDGITRGQYTFKYGDKVMQIRNNYEKEVFNGDVGTVVDIDIDLGVLSVQFDGYPVVYEKAEIDELILAYACTIHKSQGSEYPIVVIPVVRSHYIMLQRNLIYTAITRAKKLCVLIGSLDALKVAVRTQPSLNRNTRLMERMQELSEEERWNKEPDEGCLF